ncbi:hypothetical protein VD659_03820 [Herbiconiux sp. 11R-BC]|uniref:hypothetical protein n=1 Tax=Herbiconiux sp. 11R-BC TaxID=3111637 RepID=UPI003BFFEFB2
MTDKSDCVNSRLLEAYSTIVTAGHRSPLLHTKLMNDVWELANRKAALAAQLAEVDQLHRQAIVLAHTFGIKQPILATLSDVTPGRISQIVQSTEMPDAGPDKFHAEVYRTLEGATTTASESNARSRKGTPKPS